MLKLIQHSNQVKSKHVAREEGCCFSLRLIYIQTNELHYVKEMGRTEGRGKIFLAGISTGSVPQELRVLIKAVATFTRWKMTTQGIYLQKFLAAVCAASSTAQN